MLVESRVGEARDVRVAMLFERALHQNTSGALSPFAEAFRRWRPALTPAVGVPPLDGNAEARLTLIDGGWRVGRAAARCRRVGR